jgi:recombination protein RecA
MLSALPSGWRFAAPPDLLSTPLHDFPRGRISEINGPRSSGRTALLHAVLAASTGQDEYAALIDTSDAFDPCSAAAAGVRLEKLLWVRCGGNTEHALRAADLLLQAGGFGVVALDLIEAAPAALARIPPTAWFRFRRSIEPASTILLVLADRPLTKSCASERIKLERRRPVFIGQAPFQLLLGEKGTDPVPVLRLAPESTASTRGQGNLSSFPHKKAV